MHACAIRWRKGRGSIGSKSSLLLPYCSHLCGIEGADFATSTCGKNVFIKTCFLQVHTGWFFHHLELFTVSPKKRRMEKDPSTAANCVCQAAYVACVVASCFCCVFLGCPPPLMLPILAGECEKRVLAPFVWLPPQADSSPPARQRHVRA